MLPKGRGPHPWAWAIRTGETEIGMTYHYMDATFDTGNILAQKAIPIGPDDTEETLIPHFQAAADELLPEVFAKLEAGDPGVPQVGGEYQHAVRARVRGRRPHAAARRRCTGRCAPGASCRRSAGSARCSTARRLVRTSLTEVDGAERLDCGDGPLWIVEAVPA